MTVVGAAAELVAALEGLLELVAGACCEDEGCAALDAGAAEVEEGCDSTVVEAGAAAVIVDAASCDVGVSDVAGDAAAAGEEFTEAVITPWRGTMFCAGERSVSTKTPRGTRTRTSKPARVTRMPKVCTVLPVSIFGRE